MKRTSVIGSSGASGDRKIVLKYGNTGLPNGCHSFQAHAPPVTSPPAALPTAKAPIFGNGRSTTANAMTAPIRNVALVSFNPTAAPIKRPATTRRTAYRSPADKIRPRHAITGNAVTISEKLVPTSDSVIGPNAAMTTDARTAHAEAEAPSNNRDIHQTRARLRPWMAPIRIPQNGAPTPCRNK